MWEEKAREVISEIATALRDDSPDGQSMIPKVHRLTDSAGRQNRFRETKPGDKYSPMNQKAVEVRSELENLEAALSVDDIGKALEHAEAALEVLDDQRTD